MWVSDEDNVIRNKSIEVSRQCRIWPSPFWIWSLRKTSAYICRSRRGEDKGTKWLAYEWDWQIKRKALSCDAQTMTNDVEIYDAQIMMNEFLMVDVPRMKDVVSCDAQTLT